MTPAGLSTACGKQAWIVHPPWTVGAPALCGGAAVSAGRICPTYEVTPAVLATPRGPDTTEVTVMPSADSTRVPPARTTVRDRGRRYPLAPLYKAMGEPSIAAANRKLRLSGSTEQKYRREGVTEKVADRLAARAGLATYAVWPEMVDHAIDDVSKPCAGPGCTERFVPYRASQKYCSKGCSSRAKRQRERERDPEAAKRAKARFLARNRDRYRAYNREYQREYMRRVRARRKAAATAETGVEEAA